MPVTYRYSYNTSDGGSESFSWSGNDPGAGPGFSLFNSDGRMNMGGMAGMRLNQRMGPSGGLRGANKPSPSSNLPTSASSNIGKSNWSRRSVKPGPPIPCQNYDEIIKYCQENNTLWEDADFPATDKSIAMKKGYRPFEWKRPSEIVPDPHFQVGGASRFDVKQGELGDCWLLAAIASLTLHSELQDRVVPPNQSFEENYCGVFRFNFWHQGEWTEICVDDRLPTYRNKLVFIQSQDSNEFWSALLEKAYAKLVGSYENLKGGSTTEAMEDFTGGVAETFNLREAPDNLFSIMTKAVDRSSLMGCAIDASPSELEAECANGLVKGHAYSVTGVTTVEVNTPRMQGKLPMVRCRNPWGTSEWNGAWSDQSREWNLVSEEERERMGLTFSDDGEFWMTYQDFVSNYTKLEICNLGPDSCTEEEIAAGAKRWEASCEHGAWIKRVNAGGCRNFLETFWTNPQYRVTLVDPDEDEDNLCTLIVALMQKDRRRKRSEGLDLLTIGYVIYKLAGNEDQAGPLAIGFFKYNSSVARSPSFVNTREVCGRHKLEPGVYAVLPSTFDPGEESDFMLRLYTEKCATSNEMDEETGICEERPTTPEVDDNDPATEALKNSFSRIAGTDMEIDAFELKEILNVAFQRDFSFDGFTLETARSMVAMLDVDRSGKLGFSEFRKLWVKLRQWKEVFAAQDKDGSGNLSSYELRAALRATGIRLSNETLTTLVFRYSRRDGNIPFDDFIMCAVRLQHMMDAFKAHEQSDGIAEFTLDEFIQTTLYA